MARRWMHSRRAVGVVVVAIALVAARSGRGDPPDSLAVAGAHPTESAAGMNEAAWASQLIDFLGLGSALPEEPSDADRFSLLCADRAEMAVDAGGRRVPADEAFRVAVEAPRPREAGGPVRVVVDVPGTALYRLSVEGVGVQRWVIDQRPVGHLDLSALGVMQSKAIVPLRAGPHEISGYLAPGARVDRIELAAHRIVCVAPADGWHAERPLRWGALARTLVRAFDFERRLPVHPGEQIAIEGERFDEASEGGGSTTRRLDAPASGGAWAAAVSSPVEFHWQLALEEPRVVTIEARTHGVLPQLWTLDGRYRALVYPESVEGGFAWNHVVTLPLASGRHGLRALIARGSGVDEIRVVSHRSSDSDYVEVLEQLGFPGGAAARPVSRSEAADALARPGFLELAAAFRLRIAGDTRDHPLALVEDEPEPLYTRPLVPLLPAEL